MPLEAGEPALLSPCQYRGLLTGKLGRDGDDVLVNPRVLVVGDALSRLENEIVGLWGNPCQVA